MTRRNPLGQPIGEPVPDWTPRPRPDRRPFEGRFCRLEPLDPARHALDLFAANALDAEGRMWTYLSIGPFAELAAYRAWATGAAAGDDPLFFAIINQGTGDQTTGRAVGVAAYLRIEPAVGVIEIGHLAFSPLLQRRPAATEALYLLLRRAFDELGYRRCEWKCDSLNAPSRAAAERLGFRFEGLFRQALIYKGRTRDTAWYAMLDREWPERRAAFEAWLAPENFDAEGRQRRPLARIGSEGASG